jgi:hypothetical protein
VLEHDSKFSDKFRDKTPKYYPKFLAEFEKGQKFLLSGIWCTP